MATNPITLTENPWLDDELLKQRRRQRRWLRSLDSLVFQGYRYPPAPSLHDPYEATLCERMLRDWADEQSELRDGAVDLVNEGQMRYEVWRQAWQSLDDSIGHFPAVADALNEEFRSSNLASVDQAAATSLRHNVVIPLHWADGLAGDGYRDQRITTAD